MSDPDGVPEDWDEPILADGQQQARRKCKAMADDYTEQGRSEIELIDVIKASTKTRNRYLCRFRSQP
ncbi:hypothetical protein [Leptolyngbya sp. PCC 6406]|uniref:hypothetical protein n=1 Tax=Leptolyngbya sp. PCC 6406 TaxID=1173264 RepID=UPI0002F219A8|nr:hypothetical protein [Leptolyngbya sp. PCC 6406]